ncbi:MAG: hypothetical protein EXR72_20290 [Myxococcales bacterium]|nr:hypothetical protein [Myxococcales bacterium]
MRPAVPLLIEFVPGSRLEHEPEHVPHPGALPIAGNGPPGTFVSLSDGRRISLPTDQIVLGDDRGGAARVGFGGMSFGGFAGGFLVFHRVRDLRPESELSPERRNRMTLEPDMVAAVTVEGRHVWPTSH